MAKEKKLPIYKISGILVADRQSLYELRGILMGFLSCATLNAKKISEIEIAVCEGMSNILDHAYLKRYRGKVFFEFLLENRCFEAKLVDMGAPFRAKIRSFPKPDWKLFIEKERRRGFGLYVMQKASDSIKHTHRGRFNTLVIKKRI